MERMMVLISIMARFATTCRMVGWKHSSIQNRPTTDMSAPSLPPMERKAKSPAKKCSFLAVRSDAVSSLCHASILWGNVSLWCSSVPG